jgi:hypothetical protein
VSLTGCIPGDWSCQCSQCGYGDVLIIYIYIYDPLLPEVMRMHGTRKLV